LASCLANGAIPIIFLVKSILDVIVYLDKFDFFGRPMLVDLDLN